MDRSYVSYHFAIRSSVAAGDSSTVALDKEMPSVCISRFLALWVCVLSRTILLCLLPESLPFLQSSALFLLLVPIPSVDR
jgi:hypothetical protein